MLPAHQLPDAEIFARFSEGPELPPVSLPVSTCVSPPCSCPRTSAGTHAPVPSAFSSASPSAVLLLLFTFGVGVFLFWRRIIAAWSCKPSINMCQICLHGHTHAWIYITRRTTYMLLHGKTQLEINILHYLGGTEDSFISELYV